MSASTTVFITGVGTETGKTVTACALIRAARIAKRSVSAFKPVSSGFDPVNPAASDGGRLLDALGVEMTEANLEQVAPLRYLAPLSPPDAAAREDAFLLMADVIVRCETRITQASLAGGLLLIEGAGGVMSPIASDGLNVDLMEQLGAPVVLSAANWLGSISQVLTALESLAARKLPVTAVVLHGVKNGPPIQNTVAALRRYAPRTKILTGAGWPEALLAAIDAGG